MASAGAHHLSVAAAAGGAHAAIVQQVAAALHALASPMASQADMASAEGLLHSFTRAVPTLDALVDALLQLLCDTSGSVPRYMRMLAMTILKNVVVAAHWEESADGSVAVVSEPCKRTVRARLPLLLMDGDANMRDMTSVTICRVAECDYPSDWPELLPVHAQLILRAAAAPGSDSPGLAPVWLACEGALRVLEAFVDKDDFEATLSIASHVLPGVAAVAAGSAGYMSSTDVRLLHPTCVFALSVRTRALSLARALVGNLSSTLMYGDAVYKRNVRACITSHVHALLTAAATGMAHGAWDAHSVCFRYAAARLVLEFMQAFPTQVKAYLPSILESFGRMIPVAGDAFVRADVDGDPLESLGAPALPPSPLDACADNSEEVQSVGRPESLMIACIAFVQLCCLSPSALVRTFVRAHAGDVCDLLLTCAQLTDVALDSWEDDPSAFINDEEEYSFGMDARVRADVRESVIDVTHALRKRHEGLAALTATFVKALHAAGGPRVRQGWLSLSSAKWKVVEAVVFVFGHAHEQLRVHATQAAAGAAPLAMDVPSFIGAMLDMMRTGGASLGVPAGSASNVQAYVIGRCLRASAATIKSATLEQRGALVLSACDGLDAGMPLPVRWAACTSLLRMLKVCDADMVEPLAAVAFSRLNASMAAPTGEPDALASFALLTSMLAIRAPLAAAAAASASVPVLLHLWQRHASHAEVQPSAGVALEAFLRTRDNGVARGILTTVQPHVLHTLTLACTPSSRVDAAALECTLPATLRLCASIMRRRARLDAAVERAHPRAAFSAETATMLLRACTIVSTQTNASIIHDGFAAVATAIRLHGPRLVQAVTLEPIDAAVTRALGSYTDMCARCAGPTMSALVGAHTGEDRGRLIQHLLPRVLTRLVAATATLGPTLISVIAHMVLSDARTTLSALASQSVALPPSGAFAPLADSSTPSTISVAAALAGDHALAAAPVLQAGAILFLRACVRYLPVCADISARHAVAYACMHVLSEPTILAAAMGWSVPSERTVSAATGAGVRTRSKTRSDVRVCIPLAVRVCAMAVEAWVGTLADAAGEGAEDDDASNSDGTADDDDDDDDDVADGDGAAAADEQPQQDGGRRGRGGARFMDADMAGALVGDGDELRMLSDIFAESQNGSRGEGIASAMSRAMRGRGDDEDEDGSDDGGDGDNAGGVGVPGLRDTTVEWDEASEDGDAALGMTDTQDAVFRSLRRGSLRTDGLALLQRLVAAAQGGHAPTAHMLAGTMQELDPDAQAAVQAHVLAAGP